MNFLCTQRFTASRADHHRIESFPAVLVLVEKRPTARVNYADVTPVNDRHDTGVKGQTFLSEVILVLLGRFLVGDPTKHAKPDQLLQAFGQQVTLDRERGFKVFE